LRILIQANAKRQFDANQNPDRPERLVDPTIRFGVMLHRNLKILREKMGRLRGQAQTKWKF
jgi:hypothetical protein